VNKNGQTARHGDMELNDQTIETSSEMKIKQEQGNHD
jgi:hypothetical protein